MTNACQKQIDIIKEKIDLYSSSCDRILNEELSSVLKSAKDIEDCFAIYNLTMSHKRNGDIRQEIFKQAFEFATNSKPLLQQLFDFFKFSNAEDFTEEVENTSFCIEIQDEIDNLKN